MKICSQHHRIILKLFLLSVFFVSCNSSVTSPQSTVDPVQVKTLMVSQTDSSIKSNPSANHVYRECDNGVCIDDNLLFIFFPGSDGSPSNHTKVAEIIGKTGIRVLVLAYQNNGSLKSICGSTDSCYTNVRQDRLNGSDSSTYVSSVADGVSNRLLKALQSLGWSQFYSGGTILWNKIIVGGFSQGAGMAAFVGKQNEVVRVCQFSGTWDHTVGTTSASWLSQPSASSASIFYGFTHKDDSLTGGVNYLNINWQALGMGTGTLQLYTSGLVGQKIYNNATDALCLGDTHACSIADSNTPLNFDGTPKFADVWKYVCGR